MKAIWPVIWKLLLLGIPYIKAWLEKRAKAKEDETEIIKKR